MQRGDLIAGRYRVDAEIGSGGPDEAWHATENGSNTAVVLRRVRLSHLAPDAQARVRERLYAEVGIASLLDHPQIASVHRLVEHDGEPWLVVTYVSAPNLTELTAAGPLAPKRAAGIGAQAAGALAYAHSRAPGVVHRAVTPLSVLVGQGDHVTLTGFGTSAFGTPAFGTSGTAAEGPVGTGARPDPRAVAFVAPEVANGLVAGPQADVFSLAATLYAAVEGRSPWGDGDLAQTRTAAMRGIVAPPRRAGALGPVLLRMLESRPRERPNATEAAQLLAAVARGERTGGRRRLWITAAAVAAVVVVAAGLVVWPRWGPGAVVGPPLPTLGDPATADPCALIRTEPFERFGNPHLETDDGSFDRCDVNIDSGQNRFAARVQLVQSDTGLPPGVQEQRVGMVIVRSPPVDGECARTMRLSDGYDVRVFAQLVQGVPPDLCAVADVATDTALAALVGGPTPRRALPFAPGSLAMVDACGLLDRATVAKVPGLETVDADPGFAGWTCDWQNVATGASVTVSYDRNKGISTSAGDRTKVAGHDAATRADQDGEGCDVTVLHRSYIDPSGSPADELLIVKADHAIRVANPCAQALAIATVAVEHLPAAP